MQQPMNQVCQQCLKLLHSAAIGIITGTLSSWTNVFCALLVAGGSACQHSSTQITACQAQTTAQQPVIMTYLLHGVASCHLVLQHNVPHLTMLFYPTGHA